MIIGEIRLKLLDEFHRRIDIYEFKPSESGDSDELDAVLLAWFEANALVWAQARIDGLVEEDKKNAR